VVTVLPGSADAFQNASWNDLLPYYQELAARPVDRDSVESWLRDWSMLESLIAEASALANFAYARNTADSNAEEAQLRFSSEIAPRAEEQRTKLQERLVKLGYVRSGLETTVQRFRNQMELFSPANVPLQTELAKLSTEWAKVIGAMTRR
jgi:oligoendopeptidase F